MDMHANWNLMLGMLPFMEAFENTREHSIHFCPCSLHYLHFIMNHALVVVQDHLWMWMLLNGCDWCKTWNAPISCGLTRPIKADRTLFCISNAVLMFFIIATFLLLYKCSIHNWTPHNTMDMHANWNLMLGMLPWMEAFVNTREHSIHFRPCSLHYLHFIMNHALVVVQDHLWMWMLLNGYDWCKTWNAPISCGLTRPINADRTFLASPMLCLCFSL